MGTLPKLEITGSLFQPLSARATSCTLVLGSENLSFKEDTPGAPDTLHLSSFQDRKHFHFTSGHYFVADEALTPDQAKTYSYLYDFHSPERTPESSQPATGLRKSKAKTSQFLNSLENLTASKIAILVVVFIVCLVGFRYAWPHMTKPIVALIPTNIDETMGENTYAALKGRLFDKSKLPLEQRERLKKRAREMAEKAGLTFKPDIYFHKTPLGPNAMALPGGPIIVTDALVKLMKEDDLILAVIGHEYGHVEERHAMRQIVHLAGITFIASLIFGADESLIEELGGIALSTWTFKNRRNHELEADIASLKIFKANNMNPTLVISAMEKLHAYMCSKYAKGTKQKCETKKSGWFSTHPSGAERIKVLREAVGN